jgi:hypothetical protein
MFTSTEELKLSYGIDTEIGKFFVDRKVPQNNLYWRDRLLYINPMPGYLFIPLYADIEFRLGIPKFQLLHEEYILFMENILHSIAKQEFQSLSLEQHVEECVSITRPVCRNPLLLQQLQSYFEGEHEIGGIPFGMPYKALNRVDSYLFTLCYFEFDDNIKRKLIDAWHALMAFYLITDDLNDIRDDIEANEDNTIAEAGLSDEGANAVEKIMYESYLTMNAINPVFANRMDYSRQQINVKEIIDEYLSGRAN